MTQMIDIDDFLPEVLRYAPNTSDVVAQRFIIQAARELCQTTKLWREHDRIEITAPQMQGVSTIRDAAIVELGKAFLNGQELKPASLEYLDDKFPGWGVEGAIVGQASYITQIQPNTVTVVPGQAGTLDVRLVLKPSRDAFSLPAFLLDDYAEEIGRGAAGKLLCDPNSSNPQLGLDHREWFQRRLDNLAIKAAMGQQNAPLRTKGAYF